MKNLKEYNIDGNHPYGLIVGIEKSKTIWFKTREDRLNFMYDHKSTPMIPVCSEEA